MPSEPRPNGGASGFIWAANAREPDDAAQPPTSLMAVYRLAQARDSSYAVARAAWAAAQEKIPQGRALLLPEVTVSANTNFNDREIAFRNDTDANDRFNTRAYSVAMTQPILRLQSRAQYAQGQLIARQADAQVAGAANDLMLRVAQAYFDVLLAQDALDVLSAQKTAVDGQLAYAKLNYDVGVAVSTDVHEAQSRYDLISSQEIVATQRAFREAPRAERDHRHGAGASRRRRPALPARAAAAERSQSSG